MTTQLKQIPVTPEGAVARALSINALPRSLYRLGAGGRDPGAATPFTGTPPASDCVGFTSWCLGHDRWQRGELTLPGWDGWINCDSAMLDALRTQRFYRYTSQPRPGDLVVFPSKYVNGSRSGAGRHGHIGLIVEVTGATPEEQGWTDNLWKRPAEVRARFLRKLRVVDCAASAWRREAGRAVQEVTAATSWNKPDARFLRYQRFAG